MENEFLALYNRCFPHYQTTGEWFDRLLAPHKAHIIEVRDGEGKLLGFSLIHGSSIALLCVDETHRGRGHGTSLLQQSEAYIRDHGGQTVTLGFGDCYILQGVPVDQGGVVLDFFKKRGYSASWESVDMHRSLGDFDKNGLDIPPSPEAVLYRFADYTNPEERRALLQAVEAAQPSWLHIFEDCDDPVMLAILDGKIAGFQILSPEDGRFLLKEGVGSIACVGVVPEARKQGIGLRMVAEGADWLKQRGRLWVELRYIFLVSWYEKVGLTVMSRQWMGSKPL